MRCGFHSVELQDLTLSDYTPAAMRFPGNDEKDTTYLFQSESSLRGTDKHIHIQARVFQRKLTIREECVVRENH